MYIRSLSLSFLITSIGVVYSNILSYIKPLPIILLIKAFIALVLLYKKL